MDSKGRLTALLQTAKALAGVAALYVVFFLVSEGPLLNNVQAQMLASLSEIPTNSHGDALKAWFQGCRYVYLDVGTNTGIQIRKLFEPELYPGASVLTIFDEMFGKDRKQRADVCAVGFEPNVHHTKRLQVLEDAYNAKGWRVKIFTETAASTKDGTAEFFFDTLAAPEHHQWGASLIPWQSDMKAASKTDSSGKSTVQTIDLSRFVNSYIRGTNTTVVMKVDVEGAEHILLPHMIITGALCRVDLVFAETHGFGEVVAAGGVTDGDFRAFFKEYVQKYDKQSCKTRFRDLDDESFGSSDFPLPEFLRRLGVMQGRL